MRWEAAYAVDASPPRLTWQSLTGFRNAGEARFEPLGALRCRVTVRMTYSVPLTLRPLEGSAVVTRLLSSTMRGAMERFKADLEEEQDEEEEEAEAEEEEEEEEEQEEEEQDGEEAEAEAEEEEGSSAVRPST